MSSFLATYVVDFDGTVHIRSGDLTKAGFPQYENPDIPLAGEEFRFRVWELWHRVGGSYQSVYRPTVSPFAGMFRQRKRELRR